MHTRIIIFCMVLISNVVHSMHSDQEVIHKYVHMYSTNIAKKTAMNNYLVASMRYGELANPDFHFADCGNYVANVAELFVDEYRPHMYIERYQYVVAQHQERENLLTEFFNAQSNLIQSELKVLNEMIDEYAPLRNMSRETSVDLDEKQNKIKIYASTLAVARGSQMQKKDILFQV